MKRFWDKVELAQSGCLEWQGSKTKRGYGQIWFEGRLVLAHRLSYEMFNGPLAKNIKVLHRCDNRKCVNPQCLKPGAHAENMADMVAKGRHWRAEQSQCKNGHPYSNDNVYTPPNGGARRCRTCIASYHKKPQ